MDQIEIMINEDFPHVNGILVMQDSEVLLRENYNGFHNNELHKVGCIFKNFISALVGIILEENLIISLNEKLVNFYYDELPNDIDKGFYHLKLCHILTKTSGIVWPGPTEELPVDMQEVFKLTVKDKPGTTFKYKPDPQIMIYFIEKITGKEFIYYANEKLFKPLGIKQYIWEKSHIEDFQISVEELIKLGKLYLNKGKWNGLTLFSEDFYCESVTPQVTGGFPERTDYGYYWWIDKYNNTEYFYASGFGGQLLCIIPELNVAIVIVSKMDKPHMENKALIRNIIECLKNK